MITVQPASLQETPREVHLLLCALGYERRSRFAAERTWGRAPRRVAFAFPSRGVHSFDENEIWFRKHDFEIIQFTYDAMQEIVQSFCKKSRVEKGDCLKVLIDISSMSRPMMAYLLAQWFRQTETASRLFLMYSPAVYVPPPTSLAPVTYSGPVIPQYAGWATKPDAPTCAIVGLGYEGGRALGALEFLEVAQAWLFPRKDGTAGMNWQFGERTPI